MKSKKSILNTAVSTLRMEAGAIDSISNFLDESFVSVVELLLGLRGRVIITGIGKSAIIAQKIVATLNSTGTPAIFMHAADAVHGDLGMIQKDDAIICLSKSGNTPEVKLLAPLLKQGGNPLIGMVGNMDSYLARQADFILNTTVEKEACPHNLAPTTSTIAQLAMGDALAICLLEARGFNEQDFARFHPGGSLGKKLYLKVSDLAVRNEKPSVNSDAAVKDVIIEISKNRLGAVAVTEDNRILGIITDGDIRRMLERHTNLANISAHEIMTANPKSVDKDELAVNALEIIKKHNITQLPVTQSNMYFGMIHLHDIIQEGII
ncbi:SIS domain-containing protein [Pedobacter sp. SYP-B3415]|uniref:KpsF/GutQ family sugar-phosphate isomerase n=1 Tax=Pedobacter sp. SYP-B3415 TaxID=2496641 RepID=UPI00101C8040|nr:KpsF/GutQ family sugar-phosphate isomerase [Pedobacter sp. SYP-B3415]